MWQQWWVSIIIVSYFCKCYSLVQCFSTGLASWPRFNSHSTKMMQCKLKWLDLILRWAVKVQQFVKRLTFFYLPVLRLPSVVFICCPWTDAYLVLQQLRTNIACDNGSVLVFQFSALYPEMLDAVVLLDTYGFLPTQLVTINGAFSCKSYRRLLIQHACGNDNNMHVYLPFLRLTCLRTWGKG